MWKNYYGLWGLGNLELFGKEYRDLDVELLMGDYDECCIKKSQ